MKKYISALLKKQDNKITFVASDETLDRSGEVIPIESWDLRNFKKNPVLLVNHDYKVENIVGLAKNIRIKDKALLFDPEFHGITQLSKEVEQMVQEDILNTVSVGFMPHGPKKDGDQPTNELFEISFVPVPANPSAARLEAVLAKAADDIEKKDAIADWISKKEIKSKEETEIKEGRVLSGKNRKLINEAVSILKSAATALDELLTATESNGVKDSEEKGREPEVVKVQSDIDIKPVPTAVLRALQGINRDTNDLLNKLKKAK